MRTIDLDSLEIFRTVVAEGGVIRAARQAQPRAVERHDAHPAARGAARPQAVPAPGPRPRAVAGGRGCCCPMRERLLRLADEAESELRSGLPLGVFRLGSLESTAGSRLAPMLSRFHKLYPGVVVELVTGTTGALIQRVNALRDRGRLRLRAVHGAGPRDAAGVRGGAGADHRARHRRGLAPRRPERRDADRLRAGLLVPTAARGVARQGRRGRRRARSSSRPTRP